MEDLDLLTFEPWADPTIEGFGQDPEGIYSRLAWLPLIGPTSWLLWGTLAAQLRRDPRVTWDIAALAEAHGVQRGTGRNGMVRKTLLRLTSFHLVADAGDDHYLVRLSAPPLTARQLSHLPAYVAQLHDSAFEIARRQAG